MGKRRWLKAAALVLLSGLVLAGCGARDNGEEVKETKAGAGKIQIGMSFDSFVIERWIRDRDIFENTAKTEGAEVNVQNANGSVEEQIAQIQYFIKKKMDVIVIIAIDGDALKQVVEEAKNEGIKVIAYDRMIHNANVDLYISFDNQEVGHLMGLALSQQLPDGGEIFMIKGSPEDNNVELVDKGFAQAIEGSGLKVVYSGNCDNWLAEQAYDEVYEGLKKHPGVAGVMCGNDDLASQAFRALAENQLAGKVIIVGQDAELSACQRIIEGTQTMTVYKSVEEEAKRAAECAVALAKGEPLKDVEEKANDGTYDVPCILLKPVAVTKENMQEVIIDSGFHTEDDIYLNIR